MKTLFNDIAAYCRKIPILVWLFIYLVNSSSMVLLGSVLGTSACDDSNVILGSAKVGMTMWAVIHLTVFGLAFLTMVIGSFFYKGKSE